MDDCVANGIGYLVPDRGYLTEGLLDYAFEKGVGVLPWGVNDNESIEKSLRDRRVSGIITAKPDVAVGLRKSL